MTLWSSFLIWAVQSSGGDSGRTNKYQALSLRRHMKVWEPVYGRVLDFKHRPCLGDAVDSGCHGWDFRPYTLAVTLGPTLDS